MTRNMQKLFPHAHIAACSTAVCGAQTIIRPHKKGQRICSDCPCDQFFKLCSGAGILPPRWIMTLLSAGFIFMTGP